MDLMSVRHILLAVFGRQGVEGSGGGWWVEGSCAWMIISHMCFWRKDSSDMHWMKCRRPMKNKVFLNHCALLATPIISLVIGSGRRDLPHN